MPDIQIDTSRLTFPRVAVPEGGTGFVDGSASPPPTVSLPIRDGYHLQQGTGPLPGFTFAVTPDGTVDFDPAFDRFLAGRGERRLTARGLPVRLDGTALDVGLVLQLTDTWTPVLPPEAPHDLRLLPYARYRLDGGSAPVTAPLDFELTVDGDVRVHPGFEALARVTGTLLEVHGRTIRIDGRELFHDLLPVGMQRPNHFLHNTDEHALTVLPANGYAFSTGVLLSPLRYGVSIDGDIVLPPAFAGVATAEDNKLTLHGRGITIDARNLSHDLLPVAMEHSRGYLSNTEVHELNVLPADLYGFRPGDGNSDGHLRFGVTVDGEISLRSEFGGFASVTDHTLTIDGYPIDIDGRGLSHDLLPARIDRPNDFLPNTRINTLQLYPSGIYGFQPGSGLHADFTFDVRVDGTVDYPASCDRFLRGRGTNLLTVGGFPIILDATRADSDLVGISQLGMHAQKPRELVAVLVPAHGYLPQTVNGPFRTPFNIERDGTISFDPAMSGRYVRRTGTAPNPSRPGEEVTIAVRVRPVAITPRTPRGDVTFAAAGTPLGEAALDATGVAVFRVSTLAAGEHRIVVRYRGDELFQPSSAEVQHRVVQAD